jgi:hypothetical protein
MLKAARLLTMLLVSMLAALTPQPQAQRTSVNRDEEQ